jgi:SAM-dependent methyltransferase
VHFEVGDLTKFVDPERFDLVVCVDVMEHIEEDVQVFKNYYHSMKKGGMVLISTPSDQGGSDVHDDDDSSFIEEHVRDGYNIYEIEDKLKEAGFSKVEARYSYGTPGKISWRLSMKYPILMLGVSRLFFIVLPFYYLITYPFCFVLNWLDVSISHKTGTGLIVKAWK